MYFGFLEIYPLFLHPFFMHVKKIGVFKRIHIHFRRREKCFEKNAILGHLKLTEYQDGLYSKLFPLQNLDRLLDHIELCILSFVTKNK